MISLEKGSSLTPFASSRFSAAGLPVSYLVRIQS